MSLDFWIAPRYPNSGTMYLSAYRNGQLVIHACPPWDLETSLFRDREILPLVQTLPSNPSMGPRATHQSLSHFQRLLKVASILGAIQLP